MDSGGDDAIPPVLALLEASAEEEASVAVGTGPLEDLINDHGDALADAVERTARQSPVFRSRRMGHRRQVPAVVPTGRLGHRYSGRQRGAVTPRAGHPRAPGAMAAGTLTAPLGRHQKPSQPVSPAEPPASPARPPRDAREPARRP